jgi:HNH endonuclease
MPTDTCWIWTGATDGRYGLLDTAKAHRVSWIVNRGPIPLGRHILHRCDNTLCVQPAHLFLGDPAANARDRQAKGRTVLSPPRKLTEADVRAIRTSTEPGVTLAARFGVTGANISAIRKRATWAHVA